MVFRKKEIVFKIIASLFLFLCLKIAFALDIPVPPNTEEQKAETRNIAGRDYDFIYYASNLSVNQLKAFYSKEFNNSGWNEKKLLNEFKGLRDFKIEPDIKNSLERNLIFQKENRTVIISFMPQGIYQDKKTHYLFTAGESLSAENTKQDTNMVPVLVAKPKKDVFPVYPQAALVSLSEPEETIRATYFTKDSIDAVIEFYKLNMAGYGWVIVDEKMPEKIPSPSFDMSKYCPSCAKKAGGMAVPVSLETWVGHLYFTNQNKDTCDIVLSQVIGSGNMPKNIEATTILINYEEKK